MYASRSLRYRMPISRTRHLPSSLVLVVVFSLVGLATSAIVAISYPESPTTVTEIFGP
ncbi:MAG TPA: hypothetical protein VLX09_04145 [Stellaceae bacterium]|nr:hypothetical protein [Stellaceae bacterium]